MIVALIESVESEASPLRLCYYYYVSVFVDNHRIKRTPYETYEAAASVLHYSGFTEMTDGKWVPTLSYENFTATVSIQSMPVKRLAMPVDQPGLMENGIQLDLHIVRTPKGFGFKYIFRQFPKASDPVIGLVSMDLFDVQAIGSWASDEAALSAGCVFFDKVKQLVGGMEVMHTLLSIEKERAACQTKQRRAGMGKSLKSLEPNLQNLSRAILRKSTSL